VAKKAIAARFYFHKDHLGSSTVVSNAAGYSFAEQSEYRPFGETRSQAGIDISIYKYTDQELDTETGLYNYNARLYDPILGRFISPDSIVPDTYDPQSLNPYAYCLNNPLIYIDPSGLYWEQTDNGYVEMEGPPEEKFAARDNYLDSLASSGADVNALMYQQGIATIQWRSNVAMDMARHDGQWDNEQILNNFQDTLSAGGIVDPTFILDGVNGLIYWGRGKNDEARWAFIAMAPYVGDAIGKGWKYGSKTGIAGRILRRNLHPLTGGGMYDPLRKGGKYLKDIFIDPKQLTGIKDLYTKVYHESAHRWIYLKTVGSKIQVPKIVDKKFSAAYGWVKGNLRYYFGVK